MYNTNTSVMNYSSLEVGSILETLYQLQTIDSGIDKLTILRGELPLEIIDLEKEIKRKHGYYSSNEPFGKWVWFSNDGIIEEERNYKDGKLDGNWTYYNEDGSIEKVEEYKDGQLNKKE